MGNRKPQSSPFKGKLSDATLLLLHLAQQGHVWRNDEGRWVASTVHTSRVVHDRINALIGKGFLSATFEANFPKVTQEGEKYLAAHPVREVLSRNKIT
jgi:hypothetical protein